MAWRIFLIFFIFSMSVQANEASETSEAAEYEAKLEALKKTINQSQSDLESVRSERDALQNQLQESETNISELTKKIEEIKDNIEQEKQQLDELNDQRSELKGAQRLQQQQIAQHINTAYRLGQQSKVKLLLNQDEPDKVSRMLKYYDYFLDARANKISTYLDTIAELNRVEPRIKKKHNGLTAIATSFNNAISS